MKISINRSVAGYLTAAEITNFPFLTGELSFLFVIFIPNNYFSR